MSNSYPLSSDERKFYEDNGYLVISNLIDFDSLYTFRRRFIDISNGTVDKGNITVVREPALLAKGLKGEDVINKLQEVHFDDVFCRYTEHPRLLAVLAQLIGPEMRVTNSMFINKPPGSTMHPSHQDLAYFPFRPAHKITAAWTAVDHVTEENGGLYLVPGSHRAGKLYEHKHLSGALKLYHGIVEEAPVEPRTVLEMAPGDTVFFHPLLVHGSGPNTTQRYRKALTAHYASESCEYVDVRAGPQAHIVQDVERESQRRGYRMTFEDIWRYKSKSINVIASKL